MFSKSCSTPCSLVIVSQFHMWKCRKTHHLAILRVCDLFGMVSETWPQINGESWPPTIGDQVGSRLESLGSFDSWIEHLAWLDRKRSVMFFWCSGYYHLLGSAQPPAGSILIGVSFIKREKQLVPGSFRNEFTPKELEIIIEKPSWAGNN